MQLRLERVVEGAKAMDEIIAPKIAEVEKYLAQMNEDFDCMTDMFLAANAAKRQYKAERDAAKIAMDELTLARTCAAFPKGIPLEIWNGENDHAQEFPGDNGIRFEPFVPTANARAGEL